MGTDAPAVDAIARAVARDEIRQLAYRYAAAIEQRDADAMVDLFVPHARFGPYGEGPEALRRLMHEAMAGSLFAVILVANHLIEVEESGRATGEVWAHCYAQTDRDGFLEQLIKYEDRYERHQGRWLFLHRRHRLWYGVGHPASPLRQEPADWPKRQVGVGDIPLADPRFREWRRGNP